MNTSAGYLKQFISNITFLCNTYPNLLHSLPSFLSFSFFFCSFSYFFLTFLLYRCGSRTGEWKTNGRDTPCRGLTLSSTHLGRSLWAVPPLPPPYRTPSSRPTSHISPSTITIPWLSPHQHPQHTVATTPPWGPWMPSASLSTTTDQGGYLQPLCMPPPVSCTIQLHAPAPSACTGDQNICSKLEGRHWDWANPVVPKPTSSPQVWSGGRRWCDNRWTWTKAVKLLSDKKLQTNSCNHCDFNKCCLHGGACQVATAIH